MTCIVRIPRAILFWERIACRVCIMPRDSAPPADAMVDLPLAAGAGCAWRMMPAPSKSKSSAPTGLGGLRAPVRSIARRPRRRKSSPCCSNGPAFARASPAVRAFTVTISVERVSAEPEPREFRAEARWGDDVLASAQASDAVAAYQGAASAAAQVLSRSELGARIIAAADDLPDATG